MSQSRTSLRPSAGHGPSLHGEILSVCWPEIVAILLLLGLHWLPGLPGLPWRDPAPPPWVAASGWVARFLGLSVSIRCSWCGAVLLHGLGHGLLRAGLDRDASALSLDNLLEHQPPQWFFGSLLPLMPIGWHGRPDQAGPWVEAGDPTPWKVRLKAGGGLLPHLVVVLALLPLLLPLGARPLPTDFLPAEWNAPSGLWWAPCSLWSLVVVNTVLLLASHTDWLALVSGRADRFHCGNFGFIVDRERVAADELLSARGIDRFRTMALQTEVRGAQAGGALVLARDRGGHVRFVGQKLVNGKRRNLTGCLEAAFRRRRRRAVRAGLRPLGSGLTAAWHYRFGTSGPPAVVETHWHEWSPARIDSLWQWKEQGWQKSFANIQHRITHNGDFDGIRMFGGFVDHVTLGLWLERVLHRHHPAVGDSAKIAGMMDLLITRGNWLASVRLGYQLAMATDFQAVFGGEAATPDAPRTAPSIATLEDWADLFEACFVDHGQSLGPAERFTSLRSRQRLQLAILPQLRQDPRLQSCSEKRLWEWIEATVLAFLHNDPERATRLFLAQAQGSFGLVTLSTLIPDQVVLGSLGQPICVGFDPEERLSVFASEPAAVDAVLTRKPQAFRLDLNQNTGEIAVLGAADIRVYSLSAGRCLSAEELVARRIYYRDHPHLRKHLSSATERMSAVDRIDPVAADLGDIPGLLLAIKDDWINPASANRQSADYLASFLVAKASYLEEKQERLLRMGLDPSLARSSHVDLLITGVENSLWVGEQFARDMAAIFPLLAVRTMSSNQLLQKLQHDLEGLGMARQTIVLAISQSGQTFSTRQVIEALDLFVREGVIREVFLLTGEPTSFVGSPILQSTFAGEPFCRRLFTNGSGRRSAEPATITVAATHQTLTELLFRVCRQLQVNFPDRRPLGMTLSSTSLLRLENMEDHHFLQSVAEITGTDLHGRTRGSRLHRQIVAAGEIWGRHVLEAPIAWGLHALYIAITVGWVIVFGTTIPLVQTLWHALARASGLPLDSLPFHAVATMAVIADVGFYIFGPWFWTLGLRVLQQRQILARTGRRTLVIGDVDWVQQLLTNFVSKLFSMSYGIAGLDVHGSNPQDEFVHEHAHRVVRGTLLYLGVPDGRCSGQQHSEENSVLLTGRQAHGIQHLGAGPEIVLVGSNPTIASKGIGHALVLPSPIHEACAEYGNEYGADYDAAIDAETGGDRIMESLRESRFGSFRRLLAGYVCFWAMVRTVAGCPCLPFEFWKTQSRTKVMTTAAPVSAATLDRPEQEEVSRLGLSAYANREQS
jgi:hypothetical protein